MLLLNDLLRRAAVRRYLPLVAKVKPGDLADVARTLCEEDDQTARRVYAALTIALRERFPRDDYYRDMPAEGSR